MITTRRDFLKHGLGGATLLATGASLPGFLLRTARAATPGRDRRIFVVVQLTGGNDGLNTVIPYRDDNYHRVRPTLAMGADKVHKLDDALGLHPAMDGFKRLYDEGLLSVITNVGYPNPNRSHFESMDIWHCAETQARRRRDGWLGRIVDHYARPGGAPLALHLDSEPLPLALKTQKRPVPSIEDVRAFRLQDQDDTLQQAIALPRSANTAASNRLDDLLFVQQTALASCANARRIEQVVGAAPVRSPYPDYGLAQRLQQIALLIGADFGPRIYYTSLGGFDTHARQVVSHGPLLRELATSVAAFFDDLRAKQLADRVVLMTFSEFGRRVKENASQGTDHGAAAPMFMAGPAVRPGIHGRPPDLSNLLEGDVRFETDFREVYAEVLDNWLAFGQKGILSRKYRDCNVLKTGA